MKGQYFIQGIFTTIFTVFIYFYAAVPILGPIIDEQLQGETDQATILLLHSFLFIMLALIAFSGLSFVFPKEQRGYSG